MASKNRFIASPRPTCQDEKCLNIQFRLNQPLDPSHSSPTRCQAKLFLVPDFLATPIVLMLNTFLHPMGYSTLQAWNGHSLYPNCYYLCSEQDGSVSLVSDMSKEGTMIKTDRGVDGHSVQITDRWGRVLCAREDASAVGAAAFIPSQEAALQSPESTSWRFHNNTTQHFIGSFLLKNVKTGSHLSIVSCI